MTIKGLPNREWNGVLYIPCKAIQLTVFSETDKRILRLIAPYKRDKERLKEKRIEELISNPALVGYPGTTTHRMMLIDELKDNDFLPISHQLLDRNQEYKVDGMGFVAVNFNRKHAIGYGSSGEFGLGINEEHLAQVFSELPKWTYEFR
ncbi:MAG: hypothetical protein WC533_02830 [Candidatus Pacearchaeota archaeon]